MLIVTQDQQVITMKDAIQISKEALLVLSSGRAHIPQRMNMPVNKAGQFLFKPGYINYLNIAGVKIVSVFPENTKNGKAAVQAQMLLMDATNGEMLAILDGTSLTQLRTGALQGAATDILARKDAQTGVLIGTGAQALSQLEAMLSVRNLSQIWVSGRNYATTQCFVENIQFPQFKTKITAIENCNDVIAEADIITAVTNATTPVFDPNLVRKGTHINGMGSFTPQMQELPEEIITAAEKVFFDTKEGVLAEAGDFIIPMQRGVVFDNCHEIGDVLLGKVSGRETAQEITLFKSVGTAVLDILTAFHVYKQTLTQQKS